MYLLPKRAVLISVNCLHFRFSVMTIWVEFWKCCLSSIPHFINFWHEDPSLISFYTCWLYEPSDFSQLFHHLVNWMYFSVILLYKENMLIVSCPYVIEPVAPITFEQMNFDMNVMSPKTIPSDYKQYQHGDRDDLWDSSDTTDNQCAILKHRMLTVAV
jgi:hypothetical protein